MATKMTYAERVSKASALGNKGDNKKAIYQLKMAMKLEPSKAKELKNAIAILEKPEEIKPEEVKPEEAKPEEIKPEEKILDPDEVIKFKVLKSFTSDSGHHKKNDIIDWERWRKCYKKRVVALEDM